MENTSFEKNILCPFSNICEDDCFSPTPCSYSLAAEKMKGKIKELEERNKELEKENEELKKKI